MAHGAHGWPLVWLVVTALAPFQTGCTTQCEEGTVRQGGACVRVCNRDGDCAGGQVCRDGVCTDGAAGGSSSAAPASSASSSGSAASTSSVPPSSTASGTGAPAVVPDVITLTQLHSFPFQFLPAVAGARWSVVETGGGTVDPVTGVYTAPNVAGVFHVRVTAGGTQAQATVNVAAYGLAHLAGGLGGRGDEMGPVATARFNKPRGVVEIPGDGLVVADMGSETLRLVQGGVVSALAGQVQSPGTADGVGPLARLNDPFGLALASNGDILFSDAWNANIRTVTPTGGVTTLAGLTQMAGYLDSAMPLQARFTKPRGLLVTESLGAGSFLIVDGGNHVIRRYSPGSGITTYAGVPGMRGRVNGDLATARFDTPHAAALAPDGSIYIADTRNQVIRRISGTMVTTYAGTGTRGLTDGPVATAQFSRPLGVAVDAAGAVYVGDAGNHVIRKISTDGMVTTVVGVPRQAGGEEGPASTARLNQPMALFFDSHAQLTWVDGNNGTVSRLDHNGQVQHVAGRPANGAADGTGTQARFALPKGLVGLDDGSVLVVDSNNHCIRRVDPQGNTTTFAGALKVPGSQDGPRTSARFYRPWGLARDAAGRIFVTDSANHTVRMISVDGMVTTVAGQAGQEAHVDGDRNTARFHRPTGIALAPDGRLVVSESQGRTIRLVSTSGNVTTLAGTPDTSGHQDGAGSTALFNRPHGVALDEAGNILVADTQNSVIRSITPAGLVSTVAGRAGTQDSVDGQGASARFNRPQAVVHDGRGNFYIAERQDDRIRKMDALLNVTTVAGNGEPSTVPGPLPGGCESPNGVTINRMGDPVVTCRGSGDVMVVRIP